MLIDRRHERSSDLAGGLLAAGYDVVVRPGACADLAAEVAALRPDVIIIDLESPDRDVLEDMRRLGEGQPRPIVMFVDKSDGESIRTAVRAGVAAYVVKGASPERVRSVLEVAIARFEEHQALRRELHEARSTMEQRKVIERAKGLVMERRGFSEQEAYATMRKIAMERNVKIYEVAMRILDMKDLL
jgi:response regulator NasT